MPFFVFLFLTSKTAIGNTRNSLKEFRAGLLFGEYHSFWVSWEFFLIIGLGLLASFLLWVRSIRKDADRKTEIEKLKANTYQYQLEIEQVINFFSHSISKQKNVEDILWDVARNCISKLGFEDCVIYLIENDFLIQKAAWGPKTTEQNKIVNPIAIPLGNGIVGSVAISGKAEIINDTAKDERYIVDDAQRFSEIAVPIIDNGKVIGVIDSENSHKGFYTEKHLHILTTIASLCAYKIERVKAEEQAHEKEIELIRLKSDLAASQLTALRTQMNPHFIFNALNSIQQYILLGNVEEANKYLSKFSKLQREVLHHCQQQFILLDKEIEMLTLYMQLEQLRFSNTFSYNIHFSDDIDAGEIKIPPMLLQPFVENAIWHGLMPKNGNKKVEIGFMLLKDDLLICTIKDNGIGRKAAEKIKQENNTAINHKSKGLSLVYERMNILKRQFGQPFEVNITDITDVDGNIKGTQVKLSVFIA